MEAKGGKGKIQATTFNIGLEKQFVPFWNGLFHLLGKIENDVITRRTDWYGIIRDCETFEKDYLNTEGFCESCMFYQMPSFLKEVMAKADAEGITDCKVISKDNDIIYMFCIERQRTRRLLRLVIFFLLLLIIVVLFGNKINGFVQIHLVPMMNEFLIKIKLYYEKLKNRPQK